MIESLFEGLRVETAIIMLCPSQLVISFEKASASRDCWSHESLESPKSEVMAYHSRGGNLNVALRTLSLSAFSQAASWQKALAVSASERIDVVLLNALVTCCARVARWQEALEVVCGLVRHSLRASVVTFNAALSACAAGRQWQLAVNLIEEMKGQRLAPDSLTLNSSSPSWSNDFCFLFFLSFYLQTLYIASVRNGLLPNSRHDASAWGGWLLATCL